MSGCRSNISMPWLSKKINVIFYNTVPSDFFWYFFKTYKTVIKPIASDNTIIVAHTASEGWESYLKNIAATSYRITERKMNYSKANPPWGDIFFGELNLRRKSSSNYFVTKDLILRLLHMHAKKNIYGKVEGS